MVNLRWVSDGEGESLGGLPGGNNGKAISRRGRGGKGRDIPTEGSGGLKPPRGTRSPIRVRGQPRKRGLPIAPAIQDALAGAKGHLDKIGVGLERVANAVQGVAEGAATEVERRQRSIQGAVQAARERGPRGGTATRRRRPKVIDRPEQTLNPLVLGIASLGGSVGEAVEKLRARGEHRAPANGNAAAYMPTRAEVMEVNGFPFNVHSDVPAALMAPEELEKGPAAVAKGLQRAAAGVGKNLQGVQQGLGESIGKAAAGVGKNLQGVQQGLGESIGKAAAGVGKNLQGVQQGLGENLRGVQEGIDHARGEVARAAGEWRGNAGKRVGALGAGLGRAAGEWQENSKLRLGMAGAAVRKAAPKPFDFEAFKSALVFAGERARAERMAQEPRLLAPAPRPEGQEEGSAPKGLRVRWGRGRPEKEEAADGGAAAGRGALVAANPLAALLEAAARGGRDLVAARQADAGRLLAGARAGGAGMHAGGGKQLGQLRLHIHLPGGASPPGGFQGFRIPPGLFAPRETRFGRDGPAASLLNPLGLLSQGVQGLQARGAGAAAAFGAAAISVRVQLQQGAGDARRTITSQIQGIFDPRRGLFTPLLAASPAWAGGIGQKKLGWHQRGEGGGGGGGGGGAPDLIAMAKAALGGGARASFDDDGVLRLSVKAPGSGPLGRVERGLRHQASVLSGIVAGGGAAAAALGGRRPGSASLSVGGAGAGALASAPVLEMRTGGVAGGAGAAEKRALQAAAPGGGGAIRPLGILGELGALGASGVSSALTVFGDPGQIQGGEGVLGPAPGNGLRMPPAQAAAEAVKAKRAAALRRYEAEKAASDRRLKNVTRVAAAAQIQSAARVMLARKRFKEARSAAIKIQNRWRVRTAVIRVKGILKASMVQAGVGFLVRREQARQKWAALILQTQVRGKIARWRFRTQRSAAYAAGMANLSQAWEAAGVSFKERSAGVARLKNAGAESLYALSLIRKFITDAQQRGPSVRARSLKGSHEGTNERAEVYKALRRGLSKQERGELYSQWGMSAKEKDRLKGLVMQRLYCDPKRLMESEDLVARADALRASPARKLSVACMI